MTVENNDRRRTFLSYTALHGAFLLYSAAALLGKMASGHAFLSTAFLGLYGLQLVLLAVYALAWQQLLKVFPLTVAYVNKGSVFLFNAIWAILLLGESFSYKELIGMAMVFAGIIVINRGD